MKHWRINTSAGELVATVKADDEERALEMIGIDYYGNWGHYFTVTEVDLVSVALERHDWVDLLDDVGNMIPAEIGKKIRDALS